MERTDKLALLLLDLIKENDHTSTMWEQMNDLRMKYSTYFEHVTLQDTIKVFVKIISLKKTGNLNYYNKVKNDIFFVGLFSTEFGDVYEQCNECNGEGRSSCDHCDGQGSTHCEDCDGDGIHSCDECKGTGNISSENGEENECDECGGSGEVNCASCNGEGREDCDYCNGGDVSCDECEGSGELMTDNVYFSETYYFSWDKNLKDICTLRLGTYDGIPFEIYDNLIQSNETFYLGSEENEGEVKDEVEAGKEYPFLVSDDGSEFKFFRRTIKVSYTDNLSKYVN